MCSGDLTCILHFVTWSCWSYTRGHEILAMYIFIICFLQNYQIFVIYCIWDHTISLTPPLFIEVPVPNHERDVFICQGHQFCTPFLLDVGNVRTVWYYFVFCFIYMLCWLTCTLYIIRITETRMNTITIKHLMYKCKCKGKKLFLIFR